MSSELQFTRKVALLLSDDQKTAIDLGCGYGRNAIYLAEQGFEVTAVDRCTECLNGLERHRLSHKIRTKNVDLEDFVFDKKYDLVLCTFVLHFLPEEEAQKIINDSILHLNDNGILAVAFFKKNGGLTVPELLSATRMMTKIDLVEKTIRDEPHPGAEYPHEHETVFYIGRK